MPIAQENSQGANRVVRQSGDSVGRKHLGFQRNIGLFFERKRDHGGLSAGRLGIA